MKQIKEALEAPEAEANDAEADLQGESSRCSVRVVGVLHAMFWMLLREGHKKAD